MKSSDRAGAGWVALTGTPGTGKSRVAREIVGPIVAVEVADLAMGTGTGTRTARGVTVDLSRLARRIPRRLPGPFPSVAVGHLAHLLPVEAAIVLRCDPIELVRRLTGSRRSTERERRENFVAEATDVVVGECTQRGIEAWEIDTTSRSVGSVAREVRRLLQRGPSGRKRHVDWLADPAVTARLLPRRG